ncbi:MAG: SGNH/GDSL hydrolase family protein [Kiritimatiellia bacterium]
MKEMKQGKRPTVAVFGGSFSCGKSSQVAKRAWSEALGIDVVDYGIGGMGFLAGAAVANDVPNQIRRALAADETYRAFILWASTNDIHEFTVDEQNAAIERCVEMIRTEAPGSRIVFFASMPWPLSPEKNAVLGRFVQGQLETCARLDVPCLDLYRKSGITMENARRYIEDDDVHPKEAGYDKVKDVQIDFLRQHL